MVIVADFTIMSNEYCNYFQEFIVHRRLVSESTRKPCVVGAVTDRLPKRHEPWAVTGVTKLLLLPLARAWTMPESARMRDDCRSLEVAQS